MGEFDVAAGGEFFLPLLLLLLLLIWILTFVVDTALFLLFGVVATTAFSAFLTLF